MTSQIIIFCLTLIVATFGKDTRIIDGVYADITDFAFHAALRRISDNKHLCGGAIITRFNILTAAHCVLEPFVSHVNLKVVVGTSNTSNTEGTTRLPDRIFMHPKFTGDLEEDQVTHNDIAVVRVNFPIEFDKYQHSIRLPTYNIQNGDIGILSGWGSTTYPLVTLSDILRKNWMKIIDFRRCKQHLPFKMRQDQFCAFQKEGSGPCVGDSGGPLVNLNHIVGIVSIVRPCATGVPDIYTNVYSHLDFIKLASNLRD